MTLSELVAAFRQRVDDLEGKLLWSDGEVKSLINEAYYEAAERSQILKGESKLSLRQGKATYTVPNAIRIEWLWLDAKALTLYHRDAAGHDAAQWRDTDQGKPVQALVNEDQVRVYPVPDQAYTATVAYRRMPSAALIADTDVPELPSRYHLRMLDWAFHLAYDKHDSDTTDGNLSAQYAAKFSESFGPRFTAAQQAARADSRRHVIKPYW